jgi:DNA protecting protein DprA
VSDSSPLPSTLRDAHGVPLDESARQEARVSKETRAFLALAAVRGVGQKTLFALADAGRRFSEVLDNGPDTASDQNGVQTRNDPPMSPRQWSAVRNSALARADVIGERLARAGVTIVFRSDPCFPPQLLDLERPPHWLFVQGDIDLLKQPSVAIVGTRKPTGDGQFLTRYIGACLGDWAAPTVSGLAAGIDQLAHEVSLRAGVPTIAVLGTGILEDYPKGAGTMRGHMLDQGGTIVSEYLPGISYSAENFVQRNRLQAALGKVLIPAEWERRSGTAHTVRFATQLARPIACLRLPEWRQDRVMLETGLGLETGTIFTVPREHESFDRFVREAIGGSIRQGAKQLSLFDEG